MADKYNDGYLDTGMRGWIVNTARASYRRIANYDMDDLVQEGYCCYYKCRSRYVGVEGLVTRSGEACRFLPNENPDKLARQHFQALVKTTFSNRIATLIVKQPVGQEIPISDMTRVDQTTESAWEQIMPTEAENQTAAALLMSAPAEIKQLFQLLVDDALELSGYRRFGKGKRAPRETTNRRFCRLLGLSPEHDLVGQIQNHFLK